LNTKIKITHSSDGGHADNVFNIVASLLPNGTNKIVDLGCGVFRWEKKDYIIERVDIKEYSDAIPYNLNKDFPFKDKEFNGVVSIELIEHLANPFHFLKECFRISKGWVIVSTPDITKQFVRERWFGINAKQYGHTIECPIEVFKLACEENSWSIVAIKRSEVSIVVKMVPNY